MQGPEQPDTLVSMDNLALVLKSRGRYEEVESMHRQTLELRQKCWALSIQTPSPVNNLAFVLYGQRKYIDAITLMKKCLQPRARVLGLVYLFTRSSANVLETWMMREK